MGRSLAHRAACLVSGVLLFHSLHVNASFIYRNFKETDGLLFVGSAGTTNCGSEPLNDYGDRQGIADRFNEESLIERGETTVLVTESIVETNIVQYNEETQRDLAGFLHRQETVSSPQSCETRVRLTPSGPSKAGAVWFHEAAPVSNGFDTFFSFQVSDHSKECSFSMDQFFSTTHHRTCSVHGGDGFAFVIQNSVNGSTALGENGGQMGFGGIENSLAIAFDMWQNPGEDTVGEDHVSIQSRGREKNDALEAGLLGVPRNINKNGLADGRVHIARVAYFGELKSEYFDRLIASDNLIPYLRDNGEQKRIGTLLVWVDDGIASDTPILALPINLSLLLDMPVDRAFVGFTSSTGRFYEKHDILSWVWCDQGPCDMPTIEDFDYHQTSAFSGVGRRFIEPGSGFGSGSSDTFPTKHTSPDTSTWPVEQTTFSTGHVEGLSKYADRQVPPDTLY